MIESEKSIAANLDGSGWRAVRFVPAGKGAVIPAKLIFLYVSVGRGHPFYLDGINDALIRQGKVGIVRATEDVFELTGGLSGIGWKTVHWLYRKGASPGIINRVYHSLRHANDYNRDSLGLRILGRPLAEKYKRDPATLLVSHPILVGALRNRPDLVYQHGELIAPSESIVKGASLVLVPTDEVAQHFLNAGYDAGSVVVSGLCIEPPLVKQAEGCMRMRLERYGMNGPLTGAFFSSGAEPKEHVAAIALGGISLATRGHRVIIFAQQGGRLAKRVVRAFRQADIPLGKVAASEMISDDLPRSLLVEYSSRREETTLTARLFPSFDFFVAPSHERSNWAVGLGLPLFILEPCIGPFAPLNREYLLRHEVAIDLNSREDVVSLGERVDTLRHRGRLDSLARSGWGKFPIDGFSRIASLLVERCGV